VEERGSGMEMKQLQAEDAVNNNIIMTSVEKMLDFCRSNSLWPVTFGLACCAIEMMAAGGARYDLSRFGFEVFRPSPRQADLMIVAGTVTDKMAPLVKRLYDQMPEPKYVIAMGNCAISGGAFADSYNVLRGVDQIIPVDVFVPGCPPRPEALIDGFLKLREKLRGKKPLEVKDNA
jgi:NADH-quinone oxidoreductase subunit B